MAKSGSFTFHWTLAGAAPAGKKFRALTIVAVFSREGLAIEVGQRLRGKHVVDVSNRLVQKRGAPRYLFADNGAEFTGHLVDLWAYHHSVRIDFSRPGKPTDNAFIETFNGSLRDKCLNIHWFETLDKARRLIEAWRIEYNNTTRAALTWLLEISRRANTLCGQAVRRLEG
jgi:putative transposase